MVLIQESDQKYLREEFSKSLKSNIELIVFTAEDGQCKYCKETVQLAEEVSSLTGKIKLTIYDFNKDAEKARELGVDKYPTTIVCREGSIHGRVRYAGIPSGYEFGSLIEDIKMVSDSEVKISSKAMEGEEVVHIADHDGPPVGSRVKCILDWENRYACMRMHTAIHMLDAVFTKTLGTLGLSTGSQIYRDRARVDFSTESISRRDAEDLVERTNIEIRKDHEVKAYEISREEALSIEGLARTRPGYELIRKLETVRIVDIVGLDRQADGGTHVSRTSEIGIMTFLKFESKGRNNKRVYFTLDEP